EHAANVLAAQVPPEANIIFGAAFDPSLDGKIRVSVVATGMDGAAIAAIEPHRTLSPRTEQLIAPKTMDYAPEYSAPVAQAEPDYVEPAPVAAQLDLDELPLA